MSGRDTSGLGVADMFAHAIDADAARGARRGGHAWTPGRERRRPTRRTEATGLGPDLWELELHPVRALEDLAPDIERIERDAAEPNVFFTLPFLRAAYPRLARTRGRRVGPVLLLCLYLTRADADGIDRRRLVLFLPLLTPQLGWPGRVAATAASSEFTPLGTPLVTRDVLDEAIERLLMLLADPAMTLPPLLALPDARIDGPVAQGFRRAAATLGLPSRGVQMHERAAHFAGADLALSRKRERDYARQLRRLEERGRIEFDEARTETAVLDAFEAFVALELATWKGRRGSALYNRKHITAFSRQAVAALAQREACAIHSLKLDGRTIASLIVLGDRGSGLCTWKTAFDARHSAASPGVQVLLTATKALDAEFEAGTVIDSLAVPDHPVMDRVWSGRLAMGTLLVGLNSRATPDVEGLAAAIERRDRLRAWLKAVRSALPV